MPTILGINVAYLFYAIVMVVVGLVLMLLYGFLLSWSERKQSALMQDRIGANRCYIPLPGGKKLILWGFIHNLADATKMVFKENFKPDSNDKLLYFLAPFVAIITAMIGFAVVPLAGMFKPAEFFQAWYLKWIPALPEFFANNFQGVAWRVQAAPLNVGLLYVFGIGGLGIFTAMMAGWASNNKFSLFGALRAGAQMISYEITLGVALLGLIFLYGDVDLFTVVQRQEELWFGVIPKWGVFIQPFAFIIYFLAALAEAKRIPFDFPEAESELVSGYFTEYSGFKVLAFMLAEFIEVAFVSSIMVTLFFGGYSVPWLFANGFHWPWGGVWELSHATVILLQMVSFIVKLTFACWLLQTIRWTLPRIRYDQLMGLSWKRLLPFAIANFIVTVIIVAIGGF